MGAFQFFLVNYVIIFLVSNTFVKKLSQHSELMIGQHQTANTNLDYDDSGCVYLTLNGLLCLMSESTYI